MMTLSAETCCLFYRILYFVCGVTAVAQWLTPKNSELNPICHMLALVEAHHILHVSRIRVKVL